MNDRSVLTKGQPYPLGDWLNTEERERFGIPLGSAARGIMAVWDGSPRRPPRKGEWYFSGSPIDAYRAPNDLETPYHIGTLVRARQETRWIIEEEV